MATYRRYSPVAFDRKPAGTERRGDWLVVLRYENEGNGPHLIDLSHSGQMGRAERRPLQSPGCRGDHPRDSGPGCHRGRSAREPHEPHTGGALAPLGEWRGAAAGTGVYGNDRRRRAPGPRGERRLLDPRKGMPPRSCTPRRERALPGPRARSSTFPARSWVLDKDPDAGTVLVGFSRAYGQAMAEALLEAGADEGLVPRGRSRLCRLRERDDGRAMIGRRHSTRGCTSVTET